MQIFLIYAGLLAISVDALYHVFCLESAVALWSSFVQLVQNLEHNCLTYSDLWAPFLIMLYLVLMPN